MSLTVPLQTLGLMFRISQILPRQERCEIFFSPASSLGEMCIPVVLHAPSVFLFHKGGGWQDVLLQLLGTWIGPQGHQAEGLPYPVLYMYNSEWTPPGFTVILHTSITMFPKSPSTTLKRQAVQHTGAASRNLNLVGHRPFHHVDQVCHQF